MAQKEEPEEEVYFPALQIVHINVHCGERSVVMRSDD